MTTPWTRTAPTTKPRQHPAHAVQTLEGVWFASCDACAFAGDGTTLESEALADAEMHRRTKGQGAT